MVETYLTAKETLIASHRPSERKLLSPYLRFVLALSLVTMTGCASLIYGTSQVVPINSRPPGYPVRVLEGEKTDRPRDTTPLFEKLASGSHSEVTLELGVPPDNQQTFGCDVRWFGSIGGNALMALLFIQSPWFGLSLALGGEGIDYLNGAAYDCSRPKNFIVPLAKLKTSHRYCRRLILLPPLDVDTRVSDAIAKRIIKSYGSGATRCDHVLDYATTKDALTFLNISHYSRPNIQQIGQQRWNRLGYYLGATHLLAPRLTSTSNGPVLSIEEYGLEKMQVEREVQLDATTEMIAAERSPLSRRLYVYSLALAPNAVTYSRSTYLDVINYSNNVTSPVIKRDHDRGIDLLSNFGIENADHPDGFGLWDYSASFSPSFNMLLWSAQYRYTDPNTGADKRYQLHLNSFFLAFNGTLTGHTPLGALSLGLGLGPAYIVARDSDGDKTRAMLVGYKVDLYYTAFISGRLFFRTGFDLNWYSRSALTSANFDFRGYQESYAGLGIFLPTVRSHALEFLDGDSH